MWRRQDDPARGGIFEGRKARSNGLGKIEIGIEDVDRTQLVEGRKPVQRLRAPACSAASTAARAALRSDRNLECHNGSGAEAVVLAEKAGAETKPNCQQTHGEHAEGKRGFIVIGLSNKSGRQFNRRGIDIQRNQAPGPRRAGRLATDRGQPTCRNRRGTTPRSRSPPAFGVAQSRSRR